MTEEFGGVGCEDYAGDLPELALGVLTGRERARALAHVDACSRCADELEQLSRAADAVFLVAPDVEPPVGFEVRLLERMGVVDAPPRRHRLRPSRWIPASVAAAAAAAALGIGLSWPSAPAGQLAQAGRGHTSTASANLVEGGRTVGRVVTFGGTKPWMSMTLEDSGARGRVTCVVVTTDGVTHRIGTFVAKEGYGAWVAPLRVDPTHLRRAEVVSPSGAVIASAPLG